MNINLADDLPIENALYSHINNEIYIASGKNLKIWDLKTGTLSRVFEKISPKEITALELHSNHRLIFLGDGKGDIR